MQPTTLAKIALISLCVAFGFGHAPMARSQPTHTEPQTPTSAPSSTTTEPQTPTSDPSSTPDPPTRQRTVTDSQPPQVDPSSTPDPSPSDSTDDPNATATTSNIKVRCEDLSTVVQKGDRQAAMFNWNSKHFGSEFTPEKRCQLVSERLQAAADGNGGTLKGLQLGSGVLNEQAVICVLQTGEDNCTDGNLLFTLKPENAKNPQAVIAKIATFAESGGTSINESAGGQSKLDLDLGNWERQAFAKSRKSPTPNRNIDPGF